MAKKEEKKKIKPQPGVPTINPYTGKAFANETEKKAYMLEQQTKLDQAAERVRSKAELRSQARDKILQVFSDSGITDEEIRLVFGSRFFL